MTTKQALSGIRVLDFTRVLAGPTCTMLLGDMGADVIKIEHPIRGDDTRHWGPPWAGEGESRQSAYFLSINRNKRSVTVNLKHESGREIIRQLVRSSHILIENFKVGQMASFGLSYNDLKAINPALVYCSITGFGQTGSYSVYPGYDYAVQAMSGLMSITGEPDGQPTKVGVAISDVFAGLFASNAILSALRHAEHTGIGQYIDVALLDTQIAALVNIASNFLVSGDIPYAYGNAHPNIVPYQIFSASDGDFVLSVGNDGQFRKLCTLIQREDLSADERFATNPARVIHRDILVPILADIFVSHTADYWVQHLFEAGIPSGQIRDVSQALTHPHVVERNLVQETLLSNGELLKFVGAPVKLSETPAQVRYPPPALGQHTDDVLCEILGLNTTQLAEYHKNGVI